MYPALSISEMPWYRHPWPWLLMLGPGIVVMAGLLTAWLAVRHEDGLVADDYYKRGLAINQELRRDAAAVSLDIKARILFGGSAVRVFLSGITPVPGRLNLQLIHPTRETLDQRVVLKVGPGGWYEGQIAGWHGARRGVLLEDEARTWRLLGEVRPDNAGSLDLAARRQSQ